MLNIYYGRENLNKSKFIFDNIVENAVLMVPDQYTLEAEKDAFRYLGRKGLMDFEVLSFSRLKDKIFDETGIRNLTLIDKRGRHMLLSKIAGDEKEELKVYGRYHGSASFLNLANNLISELKQYGISSEDLDEIKKSVEEYPLLSRKLVDVQRIFKLYEEAIEGHYVDTEDLMELFCNQIKESGFVAKNEFWLYGFDVFSPKNLKAIEELIRYSKGVNVVLTYSREKADTSLFTVTADTVDRLLKAGENVNIKGNVIHISSEYLEKRPEGIAHIEKNIFALPFKTGDSREGLTFVKAANYFNEAESAALYILKKIRENQYRFEDFAVICNDLSGRGEIFKRVFKSYGIRLFVDGKRKILHSPAVKYTLSLLKIIAEGYKGEDVISLLKTGLSGMSEEEIADLENYVTEYGIKGAKWKKEFSKGARRYTKEELDKLEKLRKKAIENILIFHENYKGKRTVAGKVAVLYEFLCDMQISSQLTALAEKLVSQENTESAEEIRQAWNAIPEVMDQFVEILGDRSISAVNFAKMMRAGIEAVEIGIIPPSSDVVTMGTMQRTRTSKVKIMLVVGANDGVLPASHEEDEIFSEEEKEKIVTLAGKEISRSDVLRGQEEKMAIYKNLSKGEDELYVSYSISSGTGEEERPSVIFTRLKDMFADVKVHDDVVSLPDPKLLVGNSESTLYHLTEKLVEEKRPGEIWKEAMLWYDENLPETASRIKAGLKFNNVVKKPEKEFVKKMFDMENGELGLSASRLEEYSKCPFRHFVHYGLHPFEKKIYEVQSYDIGSIAHGTLQVLVDRLSEEGKEITSPDSKWMTVSRDEWEGMIDEIMAEQHALYEEGLLKENKTNEYRMYRAGKLCKDSAEYIISHVRKGSIEKIYTEYGFGKGKGMSPIEISGGDGKIFIQGRIDRMDILPGNIAKIIDYKTGVAEVNMNDVKAALSLQLVLYLRAVTENGMRAGGAYYFPVQENTRTESQSEEDIYRMDGISCAAEELLQNLDGQELEKTKVAAIGNRKSSSMKPDEFEEFMEKMNIKIDNMCREIESGEMEIRPKRMGQKTGCDYCEYRGICKFDIRFKDNRYEYC